LISVPTGRFVAPMLVTRALSQDVMVLAFVPLLLIPVESPSLPSNQLIHIAYVFEMSSSAFSKSLCCYI